MKITFGFYLDGAEWSAKKASLGEIVCGPLAMLQLLEGRLGLSGVDSSMPIRINEYMGRLKAANLDWYKASFHFDPWSTAKQLLAWRDELFENGWDGKSGNSPRLKALAAIEPVRLPLAPGLPDRLHSLLFALEGKSFADTLLLREPVGLLPELWRRLFEKLQSCGMRISVAERRDATPPEIIRVDASDEMTLALQMARYLKGGGNSKVAVICEGDSHIVDGILHRFGFGALGVSEPSRWRESLQVLPLWLETMWKPFHPERFLSLLQLSCTPIPDCVKFRLGNALRNDPGMGGEYWNNAWREAKEQLAAAGRTDEVQQLDSLRDLLEQERFDGNAVVKDAGVPEEILRKRCDLLVELLKPRIKEYPKLKLCLPHIRMLKTLSEGQGLINRVKLARLLDSVIGSGTADDGEREVNEFAVFSHPAMVNGDFDTVLWWNFIDRDAEKETWWSKEERQAIPGIGHSGLRQRESLAWRHAGSQAKRRLILFIPKQLRGKIVAPHPLLDELKNVEIWDSARQNVHWGLGDREASLVECSAEDQEHCRSIEPGDNTPWRALSYSQMSTFLACPYRWFLLDYLKLRPSALKLPEDKPMIGTLAHKVVEELFAISKEWTPEGAGRKAGELFDKLVPEMAAALCVPERKVESRRIRKTLIEAVNVLMEEIRKLNLTVIGTEAERTSEFDGHVFTGKIDILLKDAEGCPFVIDLKWSSGKHYEEDLKAGKALQLATYVRLLSPEFAGRGAYFLFPAKKFIHDPEQNWDTLWKKAEDSWRMRRDQMCTDGIVERGFSDKEDLKNSALPLALTAYCKNCDCSMLCDRIEE